jgi:hypothetical protein
MNAAFAILHVADPSMAGATWLDPERFTSLDEAREFVAAEEMHGVQIVLLAEIESVE